MHKHAYSIDELLQVHPGGKTALYEEIDTGRLVARKIGRSTVILETDYVEYLAALPRLVPKAKRVEVSA
ncbi:DNA-binding protein [Devosia sp.]|uniref:DNA-binding protein n=1 Tax=Devosia sp. TaxID=1871048 RepID=UPI00262C16CC|nr:DNA-binding protein [Devosia sp.]